MLKEKTTSDNEIIQCWDDVIADRKIRNQIVRYIGHNFHHSHLRPGKKVIIKSEAQQNEKQHVPQLFQSNGTRIVKTSLQEQSNAYREGEGACFAHIVRQPKHVNCLFVSNDSDSILYALLAVATRERENKKFTSECWLEITFTQKSEV